MLLLALMVGVSLGLVGAPTSASVGAAGDKLWVAQYDGPGHTQDTPFAAGVNRNGTMVYVTGFVNGPFTGGLDYGTVAHDARTGGIVWASQYNGPGNSEDLATALAVSPDDTKVFVTGRSPGGSGRGADFATIAYDAGTGAKVWVRRYDGPASAIDYATSVAVSPDGARVFVTGSSWGGVGRLEDYATIAYDAETGANLWLRRYNGPVSMSDDAYSVTVSPDGTRVFVTGYSWGGSDASSDVATIAYDPSNGAKLWVRRYNSDFEFGRVVVASPDGATVYVTGQGSTPSTGDDYLTIAYEAATGRRMWIRTYDGPAHGEDVPYGLSVSPDGVTVVVTGQSWGGGSTNLDAATVAYEASTGSQSWVQRYNGPPGNSYDVGQAVVPSPDGTTVFVAGYSDGGGSSSDYVTLAYDLDTGGDLWLSRLNGSGNGSDYAYAIAASPDGAAVYVTGSAVDSPDNINYTTVAYATS
jgi:hypothetical protein